MRSNDWQKVGALPVEDVFDEIQIQRAFSKGRRINRDFGMLGTIQLGPHRVRVQKRVIRASQTFGLCCAGCNQKADQVEFFRTPDTQDIQLQLVISGRGDPGTMTIDHILPRDQGGTNESHNLWLMCRRCNAKKANLIPAMRINDRQLHYLTV